MNQVPWAAAGCVISLVSGLGLTAVLIKDWDKPWDIKINVKNAC